MAENIGSANKVDILLYMDMDRRKQVVQIKFSLCIILVK